MNRGRQGSWEGANLMGAVMGSMECAAGPTWPLSVELLLVDDDRAWPVALARELATAGCVCHVAHGYDDALSFFVGRADIGVVVTEHGIGGGDVEEFITSLRRDRPGVIVVGSSDRPCASAFQRVGVARFLRKPWRACQLIELVSGRICSCRVCGTPLPLRRPFAGEVASDWICRRCGTNYKAVLDLDAVPQSFQKVIFADRP